MKKKFLFLILFLLFSLGVLFIFVLNVYTPSLFHKDDLVVNERVITELKSILNQEDSLTNLAFVPVDRRVSVKRDTDNQGFIFAIKNNENRERRFNYKISLSESFKEVIISHCGNDSLKNLERYPSGSVGTFLIPGNSSNAKNPEMVFLDIPKDAPKCTFPYDVEVRVSGEESIYAIGKIIVTII